MSDVPIIDIVTGYFQPSCISEIECQEKVISSVYTRYYWLCITTIGILKIAYIWYFPESIYEYTKTGAEFIHT